MDRVNEELLCFSTILRSIAHSVRAQFGTLDDAVTNPTTTPSISAATSEKKKDGERQSDDLTTKQKPASTNSNSNEEQKPLSLDETIELLDLAGQLLESDNNSFRIRALLLETRPNIVEVLVGILASNPQSVLPPSLAASTPQNIRSPASLVGAASLRHEHEQIQRRFTSLQWKAMSTLARACALAAPTDATASQFGFVLDSFEVLTISMRYLVMEDAGVSLRTCAAEVLFLCVTKLQLAQRAAATPDAVDTIVFQLAESELQYSSGGGGGGVDRPQRNDGGRGGGGEDTLRCYLVGALHAIGPIERLLSADFVDVAIGVLREGPVYACTKILELLAALCKRNPHFVPTSLPHDRVLLLTQTLGSVLTRLGDHPEVVLAVCRLLEICAVVSALAVEDEAIVRATQRMETDRGNPFAGTSPSPYTTLSYATPAVQAQLRRNHHHHQHHHTTASDSLPPVAAASSPEEGPGRFLIFFTHPHGPWRHLLIAGKTEQALVEARAFQMRAMRVILQCIINPAAMQRLADELGRDLPLFSALLSAPLRLPPFHDEAGLPYVAEASLCLTFLMAKVPSFRSNVRRAVATFPAWLQNLEQRLVQGMEAGLQAIAGEMTSVQLVDVCGNLLNSVGFVDRFAPRAWGDVQALEVCVARLFEFQLRIDPNEQRPPLANSGAADDDGAPFVAVFVDMERKAVVLTTGVLAYAICLSFQEVDPRREPYLTRHNSQSEQDGFSFTTDPSNVAQGMTVSNQQQQQQQQTLRSQSRAPADSSRGVSSSTHAYDQLVNNNNNSANLVQQLPLQSATIKNLSNNSNNAFFTGEVEAASADDTDAHSETQSDSYLAASAAQKHHSKPSPYSLHAQRSRSDQQQHHVPGNQWSAPKPQQPLQQPAHHHSRQLSAGQPKPPSSGAGGFVQRNVLSGRFEPVAHYNESAGGALMAGGIGVGPSSSSLSSRALQQPVQTTSSSSRNGTPKGRSGSSRTGTPTGRTTAAPTGSFVAGATKNRPAAAAATRSWH